ncbi:hypothetical protein AB0929_36735 [Streptomyces massasporeus]
MRQTIADGFKDVYFQDGGVRAMDLSVVAVNDIDYLGLDYWRTPGSGRHPPGRPRRAT